jgi:iron(II)-dependent oxidoreductase
LPGGDFCLGASAADGFVFDNEKWAHRTHLLPFRLALAAVTNEEFSAFVEDGGYQREPLWHREGWRWRQQAQAAHPLYWRRDSGGWQRRIYDRWQTLRMHEPVIHVNWYEADAYCRWACRRLPSEAEWEFAATTGQLPPGSKTRYPWGEAVPGALHANLFGAADGVVEVAAFAEGDSAWGCRQMLGNVWEWTADWFQPYPGYVRDPYREYSAPWFGNHKVLRGGCFATRASLLRGTWRNFYTPERRDVFAGFRTCAP